MENCLLITRIDVWCGLKIISKRTDIDIDQEKRKIDSPARPVDPVRVLELEHQARRQVLAAGASSDPRFFLLGALPTTRLEPLSTGAEAQAGVVQDLDADGAVHFQCFC